MGSTPSSTDPTASDAAGPALACILHPTRGVATHSTTQLSFKTRARNQILRLHRELIDERERHERVVKRMREQNKEDVVSLSSRVQNFEAQWSRLQQRMSELWLEVEGLKLPGHGCTPNSNASAQTLNCSTTSSSTQTLETSSSDAATQRPERAHSNLGVKDENELKQWRKAFSHLSGSPEHIASGSKITEDELRYWRTAFGSIPGTPAQKAASSKEAIDEVKQWRTSFTHVSGTPAQRAEASKSFLRRFSHEQSKNLGLTKEVKDSEHERAQQKSEIRRLQERNLNLSTELDREMSKRKKLLRAVEEYQRTSTPQNDTKRLTSTTGPSSSRRGPDIDNRPKSPNSVQLPKRKREVSELDRQEDEPPPASQRRRTGYSDSGWGQGERQRTIMAQWTAPQNLSGYQGFPVSSTMWSMPPTGVPMGSSWGTRSSIPTAPYPSSGPYSASYPIGTNGVVEGPWRNSGDVETLPSRRSSTASSIIDDTCTNESMPKTSLPVEKKWKHSMLKKGH